MVKLRCYFDGACEPKNPGGTIGWGWHLCNGEEEICMSAEGSGHLPAAPENTNNVAEYLAVKHLISFLIESGEALDADVVIHGDSQLVVKQMNGQYKIGAGAYVKVAEEVRERLAILKGMAAKVTFRWIPREENGKADELSKRHVMQK